MSALNRSEGMISLETCQEMIDLRDQQLGLNHDLMRYNKLIKELIDDMSKQFNKDNTESKLKYMKWDAKHMTIEMVQLRKILKDSMSELTSIECCGK